MPSSTNARTMQSKSNQVQYLSLIRTYASRMSLGKRMKMLSENILQAYKGPRIRV